VAGRISALIDEGLAARNRRLLPGSTS